MRESASIFPKQTEQKINMNKLQTTALLSAIGAFAVAVQAEPAWNYTFDTAADDSMEALTNTYWHAESIDAASEIVALTGSEYEEGAPDAVTGNVLKLATDAADFTFTPSEAVDGAAADEVLVDADVYFVGSDTAPAIEAGTVQTALYLDVPEEDPDSLEPVVPTLKLYASDARTGLDGWISLTNNNVSIEDKSWHHVQVRIDYNANHTLVRVLIDGVEATPSGEDTPNLASYDNWDDAKTLNSVAFRGTGAVDNFVGDTFVSARYNFAEEIYVDDQLSGAYTNELVAPGTVAASGSGAFPEFAKTVDSKKIDHVDVYDFTSGAYTTYTGFVYEGDVITALPAGFPGEIGEEDPFGDIPVSFSIATDGADGEDGSTYVMIKIYYGESTPPQPEEGFPAEWNVPADVSQAVADNFAIWKAAQGQADITTDAAAKAFLLGVDVGDELPDLEITAISIDADGNVTVEGDVDACNGVVYIRKSETLEGLPTGEAVALDAVITDEPDTQFFKLCVDFTMPAAKPE